MIEIIDKILKTGLFKHRVVRGEDVCSFADIIVRDVVYEEVNPFKRRKLHGVVGQALEKVYAGKIDEHLGELASHFLESGNKDKALEYFLKAGDKAANTHANSETASYLQSALKLLEEREGELQEKACVLEKLGDIKNIVGEYEACMSRWNEALVLWKQLDEKGKVARLHRKMANILWEKMGDTEKAERRHEEALKILETGPESVELASLYEDMARMYLHTESVAKALPWAEKALELSKKLNHLESTANSYLTLGSTIGNSGDWKKGVECTERGLKIALDNGYMETAIRAYNNLAPMLPYEEAPRSLDCYEKGFELARKAGLIFWTSRIGTHMSMLYFDMGNANKAITLAEESVALDRKAGNVTHLSISLDELGFLYQVFGEWDKSEQYYKEALSNSERLKDNLSVAFAQRCLGWLYFDKGEYAKARDFFEKWHDVWGKAGMKFNQMWASLFVIAAYAELGEIEKAKNLVDNLQKSAREVEDRFLIATADFAGAILLYAQKKWDGSVELFERASQEYEGLNVRRWDPYTFARFLSYYARVCLERGGEGDRENAHGLLNQALELFQKLGAKKEVERIIAQKKLPLTKGPKSAPSPESLEHADMKSFITATPRELKLGESLELEIEATNTRKEGTFLLTKIVEVAPEGFTIAKKPELYRVEDNCLIMREKRLDPSKTELVKLVLTPKVQGTFHIKPRIVYVDENGKERICEPKPVSLTVKELGIKGWIKGER